MPRTRLSRPRGLAPQHRRALDQLRRVRGIERFYLVGGSALTFHLSHRISKDLDLFSLEPEVNLDRLWAAIKKAIPGADRVDYSDATLKVEVPARLPWLLVSRRWKFSFGRGTYRAPCRSIRPFG